MREIQIAHSPASHQQRATPGRSGDNIACDIACDQVRRAATTSCHSASAALAVSVRLANDGVHHDAPRRAVAVMDSVVTEMLGGARGTEQRCLRTLVVSGDWDAAAMESNPMTCFATPHNGM